MALALCLALACSQSVLEHAHAGESSLPALSFAQRLNEAVDEAAATLAETLRRRESDLFAEAEHGVNIGVFLVVFSDGGVLEIGRLATERMIAALGTHEGLNVMGELAFLNAPFVVKGRLSIPVQGEMSIAWSVESRTGDADFDAQVLASAVSSIRLPHDQLSRRNLLLYVRRPAGAPDLPALDVPQLEMAFDVFVERKTAGGVERKFIESGDWLGSNHQFRIRLQANTDCFAYLFIRDSKGDLYSLFPAPGITASNRIAGGTLVWAPGFDGKEKPLWYFLDDQVGTETLYLVASYDPVEDVPKLLAWLAGQAKSSQEPAESWQYRQAMKENRRYQVFGGAAIEALHEHFPLVKSFVIDHR